MWAGKLVNTRPFMISFATDTTAMIDLENMDSISGDKELKELGRDDVLHYTSYGTLRVLPGLPQCIVIAQKSLLCT